MTEEARRTRTDRRLALLLAAAAAVLFFALRPRDRFWGDAHVFVRWLEEDVWLYYHLAYMPLAHLFEWLARPFAGALPSTELGLAALSAVAGGTALAFTFRAGRELGLSRLRATAAAAVVGLTPNVWFFATALELHALHLAAYAYVAFDLCRHHRRGERPSALRAAALGVLLLATHVIGVLALPALCLLALRRDGARLDPGGLLGAAALLGGYGLVLATAIALNPRHDGGDFAHLTVGLVEGWFPSVLWEEGLAMLWALALVGLVLLPAVAVVRRVRAHSLALPVAVLVLTFVVVLPTARITERGGYWVGLAPPLALALAVWLPDARRGTAALVAVLVVQGAAAFELARTWYLPRLRVRRGHGRRRGAGGLRAVRRPQGPAERLRHLAHVGAERNPRQRRGARAAARPACRSGAQRSRARPRRRRPGGDHDRAARGRERGRAGPRARA